ncbi:DUF2382 domain-containing protein [Lujinxingia vulgaris]|uniref:DUF2382 domain-containing protein n=1 Tax=Lujinxingia vulgaris TaxID=2600176 RepID=A0A5C6X6A4_9DELT|nr:YsnF/AvaK domain-containing protein [Lujinxingia vulgaris]TXD35175.1 DUF2382 domain-containing protein [Lujinxingia vulgaris]
MSMSVIALYENVDQAKSTVKELKNADISRSNIDFIKNADEDHQGFFKGLFSDADSDQAEAKKSLKKLQKIGIQREEAERYAAGVRDGCSLIIVHSDDSRKIERARQIMNRYALSDVDDRYGSGRSSTLEESQAGATSSASSSAGSSSGVGAGAATGSEVGLTNAGPSGKKLQAAEEELKVGKREVETGGVRASTRVKETPVEENINLREEKVDVQRRKVDRAVDSGDHIFEEESVEFTERHEEPVVSKETHVTEEVVINQEVEEHTETIRETVRSQEIDIEELSARGNTGRYAQFKGDFDRHYTTNYAGSGHSKEEYELGYRYGMALAEHGNHRNRKWDDVEAHARKGWETRNKGTWNDFRDSIRYGWDRIRGEEEGRRPTSGM